MRRTSAPRQSGPDYAVADDRGQVLDTPTVKALVGIDILLQISGIDYSVASAGAVAGAYGDIPVRFLGRTALIANTESLAAMQKMG